MADTRKLLTQQSLNALAGVKTSRELVGDIVDGFEEASKLGSIVIDPVLLIRARTSLNEGFDTLENAIGGRKVVEGDDE